MIRIETTSVVWRLLINDAAARSLDLTTALEALREVPHLTVTTVSETPNVIDIYLSVPYVFASETKKLQIVRLMSDFIGSRPKEAR